MRDPRSSTRAVATASAVQVREGVVRRETPKWAPYARQLQPWPMRCRPAASRYRAFKPPGRAGITGTMLLQSYRP